MVAARSEITIIYNTDKLTLRQPLTVVELHVHLGRPGPQMDVGDHALNYERIEFHGNGAFTLLRHGAQLWKYEQ